jgi:outer membrane protein OmpA-like peptidoglycan-associated protein
MSPVDPYQEMKAESYPELVAPLRDLFGRDFANEFQSETSIPGAFANRNSKEFIAWLQHSLNQALGLRLATDGVMGPQTRSAIRSFQKRNGLTPDGMPGPLTEARLRALGSSPSPAADVPAQPLAATAGSAVPCRRAEVPNLSCDAPAFQVFPGASKDGDAKSLPSSESEQRDNLLRDFDINDHRLKPAHKRALDELIKFMSEDFRQRSRSSRWTVSIAGLASRTGTEAHNDILSAMRAACVERYIRFHLGDHINPTDTLDFFGRVDFNPCFEGFLGSPPGENWEYRAVRVAIHRPGKAPAPVVVDPCTFRPSVHGFRFTNNFALPAAITKFLASQGLPPGTGNFGLCGGMSFLAADHFRFGVPIPVTAAVPPVGSSLHGKILTRQLDSLKVNPARKLGPDFGAPILQFIDWMGRPDRGRGSTAALTAVQFRDLGAKFARSTKPLAVLGLVRVSTRAGGGLTDNHQVLAHCMIQLSASKHAIRIYDPNHPLRDDITLEIQEVSGEALTKEIVPGSPPETIRGFFLMSYSPQRV